METRTVPYKYMDTAWFLLSTIPNFIIGLLIKTTQKIGSSTMPNYVLGLLITSTSSQKIGSSTMPLIIPSQKICNKEEENDNVKGWSDAHQDILLLIKSRLNFVDQLRFGAVCVGWNSVPDTRYIGKLPWILGMQQHPCCGLRLCGLYDPSTQKEYRVDHQLMKPHSDQDFEVPFVLGSNRGWVFLGVISCKNGECKGIAFHAFTMETIYLPILQIEDISHYTEVRGTFSTTPTCSNCVFYVTPSADELSDEIVLFTYRHGDETWTTNKVSTHPQTLRIHDMVYINNLLYLNFRYEEIWTFDIVHEDWRHIPIDCRAIQTSAGFCLYELVEYDSEMLLVCFRFIPPHTHSIYKIDWSRKAWVEEVGLSNLALFMGDSSDISYAVSVASDYDKEKVKALGDGIYPYRKYHGHDRDFFFLPLQKDEDCEEMEGCGYCPLLPKCSGLRIWVQPH